MTGAIMASTGSYTEPLQNQARAAKEGAKQVLGEQQSTIANGLGDLAQALRKAAGEMGDKRQGNGQQAQISRFAQTAADGLERVSGSLRNKDMGSLVQEVESFARRQPVAFFGAAVAAGFLAVRFLKSSNERGSDTGRSGDMPYPY
jgi:hypothetical protein